MHVNPAVQELHCSQTFARQSTVKPLQIIPAAVCCCMASCC
jgi:hypothetical protein